MGDHEQEQLEEIEVLSSIFMTELIVESADPGSSPKIFSLQLKPHPNEEEENFGKHHYLFRTVSAWLKH